ncbi:MAG: hypothetical protein ABIG63_22400 [Chloroflexota bacterium]
MSGSVPYIPGRPQKKDGPLTRFLPPIRGGVASAWLENHIPKGSWILDPFGAAPDLAVEAARSGYRVLVTANNPVMRFILEMSADPPSIADLQAALATVASSHVRGGRLEPHIKSLYATQCAECGGTVMADAFLWERDATAPFARIYRCPHCGDAGERTASEADITQVAHFVDSGLHRARALERVAPLRDPDRVHAEEALAVYPARAVYVLATVINKLDGLRLPPAQRNHLAALLLTAFDQSNTLWPHPTERERPRQLTIPPQYRENNIWLAMEAAIESWASLDVPIPLTRWPEPPPPEGGICLFEGRIKDLAERLVDIEISAVLTAIPRPNQAFWTLSALWSGWLWGYEAVEHFKSVLRRRRYDWGWHATALHAALNSLSPALPGEIPIFSLIGEPEPGFLSAVVLAAQLAGFDLQGIALRVEDNQTQITWQHTPTVGSRGPLPLTPKVGGRGAIGGRGARNLEEIISEGCKTYLKTRGEPSEYLYLHAAGLGELAKNHPLSADQPPGETLSQVQAAFQHALSYRMGFLRYKGSGKSLEVGQWWIQEFDPSAAPLAGRVETAIVEHLLENPGCTVPEIDTALCAAFPGSMPPDIELIQVCLESYGEQTPPDSDRWSIREQDSPSRRRAEFDAMAALITKLGQRLGFVTIQGKDSPPSIQWANLDQQPQYVFYLSASAVLGKIIMSHQPRPAQALVVLPGGRANLVAYKMKRDPHIRQIVDQSWQFIKYRHLRQLAESNTLNRENLDAQLALDPLTYAEPQIRLF